VIESGTRLLAGLQERILEFAEHGFDPSPPRAYDEADVWLLAALLQKAIRRGDVQVARRAGHQLLGRDSSRLWRRIMVTALEDIGIGSCKTATTLVGISCLPELRRRLGGNGPALDVALRLGCEAVKDRTGDQFGSIAREMAGTTHSLNQASEDAWRAVLVSTYLEWRRRLRAAFLLSEDERPAADRVEAFLAISEGFRALGVPELFMDACELYRHKSRDPLPLFVPLGLSLWLSEQRPRTTITHQLPAVEMIGGLPDYAFDPLHTRIGRRAVDLWLRSYLARPPFTTQVVAEGLWIWESGACDKTLDWPLGRVIGEESVEADMIHAGGANFAQLRDWMEAERSVLTCARKAAWESASHRPQQTNQGVLPLTAAAE
jgi:hypothetical protein